MPARNAKLRRCLAVYSQEAVLSRLRSLAQTHAMLSEKESHVAALADDAAKEMSTYAGRAAIEGPHVAPGPKAAQNSRTASSGLCAGTGIDAHRRGSLSRRARRIARERGGELVDMAI